MAIAAVDMVLSLFGTVDKFKKIRNIHHKLTLYLIAHFDTIEGVLYTRLIYEYVVYGCVMYACIWL